MSLARPYTTTFDISNINVPSTITVTKWQATNALVVTKPATPVTLTDICIHAGWELTADHAQFATSAAALALSLTPHLPNLVRTEWSRWETKSGARCTILHDVKPSASNSTEQRSSKISMKHEQPITAPTM